MLMAWQREQKIVWLWVVYTRRAGCRGERYLRLREAQFTWQRRSPRVFDFSKYSDVFRCYRSRRTRDAHARVLKSKRRDR
jgi:hypothetical protein